MDREGAVIRNSRAIGSGQARITAQRVATVALAIFTIGTDVKERLRTEEVTLKLNKRKTCNRQL